MHPSPHTTRRNLSVTWLGVGAHKVRIHIEIHMKKKGTQNVAGINVTKRILLF